MSCEGSILAKTRKYTVPYVNRSRETIIGAGRGAAVHSHIADARLMDWDYGAGRVL